MKAAVSMTDSGGLEAVRRRLSCQRPELLGQLGEPGLQRLILLDRNGDDGRGGADLPLRAFGKLRFGDMVARRLDQWSAVVCISSARLRTAVRVLSGGGLGGGRGILRL